MTYKKVKNLNESDIEVDYSNVIEKLDVYLNEKYKAEYQYKSVCIDTYDYNSGKYICQICNHSNCNFILGFIDDFCEDSLTVYIQTKLCWVLENDDLSPILKGSYLQSSNIKGIMKISKDVSKFRCGITVNDTDNIAVMKITGYDRAGLLHEPILDDDGNPQFEKVPKTRYFNLDSSTSEEYRYISDIKRCNILKTIKTNQIDIGFIEKIKKQDDDRISRLSRPTMSTLNSSRLTKFSLQRRDSNSSISSVSRRTGGKSEPVMIVEEKRHIFKAYLIPIFT